MSLGRASELQLCLETSKAGFFPQVLNAHPSATTFPPDFKDQHLILTLVLGVRDDVQILIKVHHGQFLLEDK